MGPRIALGVVAAVLTINLLVWIPLILWLRRKAIAQATAFRAELEATGEQIVFGPEPAIYRGATMQYSKVRGNGVLTLTQRRLVFQKIIGKGFELARNDIVEVREEKVFMRSIRGGARHLVVKTRSGAEIGFLSRDNAGWLKAFSLGAA